VMAYPQPITPVANSNSPVCTGSTINLLTPTIVTGSTYLWAGPNGFTSTLQNPSITNVTAANAGTYSLYIITNTCSSIAGTVDVAVDAFPIANAGLDLVACPTATSVQLVGNISGGTITGIWTTAGSGMFSPSANDLNAQYLPSAQDRSAGSVTLTLASSSKDDCSIATDDVVIRFQVLPAADAGPDLPACSQGGGVVLKGNVLIPGNGTWTTSGTGTFSPSAAQINDSGSPSYVPSAADIANGSVTLTLTANAAVASCNIPSDDMVVKFLPPPTVYAGGTRYVLKGNTIVLNPTVSDSKVTYIWMPNVFIDDNTKRNPTITGDVDMTYILQVTDSLGCTSTDKVKIIVSPPIIIPNTFTPNADGTNDLWDLQGLIAYPDATVDIFNRYGGKLFHSIGYGTPWNGTYNGKELPVGTYYYVIDTKLYNKVYSGYVTILR
jgi:gliding motility-associated-like protein